MWFQMYTRILCCLQKKCKLKYKSNSNTLFWYTAQNIVKKVVILSRLQYNCHVLFSSQVKDVTARIAKKFAISGPFNIQFLVRDSDVQVSVKPWDKLMLFISLLKMCFVLFINLATIWILLFQCCAGNWIKPQGIAVLSICVKNNWYRFHSSGYQSHDEGANQHERLAHTW